MPRPEPFSPASTFPIPEIIPIFPLPQVVFFPHTWLPLHIFEPRYRDMVLDTYQEGQCIGMALLRDGWEDQYYETPPVHQVGSVGKLVKLHNLPDGRSNIVLKGLCRYAIQEELSGRSYRLARISLPDSSPESSLDDQIRIRLRGQVDQYLRGKNEEELGHIVTTSSASDPVLINSLSAGLDFTPSEKQFLLESETLLQQARRLIDLLQLRSVVPPSTPGWG